MDSTRKVLIESSGNDEAALDTDQPLAVNRSALGSTVDSGSIAKGPYQLGFGVASLGLAAQGHSARLLGTAGAV